MKLWLLLPIEDLPAGSDPWNPWYDKAFGFVVRAETETEARAFAEADRGGEGIEITGIDHPWLDSALASCTELTADGAPGVVMQDFHAA